MKAGSRLVLVFFLTVVTTLGAAPAVRAGIPRANTPRRCRGIAARRTTTTRPTRTPTAPPASCTTSGTPRRRTTPPHRVPGECSCWDARHANSSAFPSCHVATIVMSPHTEPGRRSSAYFNHLSLPGTAEDLLGLPRLPATRKYQGLESA